jgi:hypothetical protein
MFGGEIERHFGRPVEVVFPWLLWVDAFPRWFTLCHAAELVDGQAEAEGSVYRLKMSLGGLLNKTTLMQIRDLDDDAHSYRFVRAESGNVVELAFRADADGAASRLVFGAKYEGSGRILGVPVGGNLFIKIIERAVDRSLPRLEKLIAAEEG